MSWGQSDWSTDTRFAQQGIVVVVKQKGFWANQKTSKPIKIHSFRRSVKS